MLSAAPPESPWFLLLLFLMENFKHSENEVSCVRLFVILWIVAHQAPLSVGFSRQEYGSRLPFSSPGDLSWPRDQTQVSHIAGRYFTLWAARESQGQT